jgi:hypothetical protein
MNDITMKLDILTRKIDEIEMFFEDNTIPYYGEVIKLQIQEKIKNDRIDITTSLMNYDESQLEVLKDKIDIFNIFYCCVANLGITLYKQVSMTSTRCH